MDVHQIKIVAHYVWIDLPAPASKRDVKPAAWATTDYDSYDDRQRAMLLDKVVNSYFLESVFLTFFLFYTTICATGNHDPHER